MACANGASPLSLPWTNTSVQAGSNVLVRGVNIGIGSPAQSLSLWPSFGDNNTWVPNSLDCDNSLSNLSCIAIDGGIYYTSNSSSYKFASQSSWNGSNTLTGIHTYLNDDAQVTSSSKIWGMPLVQHVVNFDFRSALGLGADSTFLKSLVSQNLAPSGDFGIWSGSQSVDNPLDGSLVVGGYDESKVGSLTNFSSIPGCIACAVVSGLEVTSSSGLTSSLLNATVPSFNIAIDPYFVVGSVPGLAVPDEVRDMLVAATNSIFLPGPGVYGWPNGQQPGNVKISFNNGYQVTIPGHELWLPQRGVNSAGQPIIQNNTSILNVLRASGKYVPATTYSWGQPFLSTNYMIVWPNDGIWGLSPISDAQKTASPSIKSLCSNTTSSSPSSGTSGTAKSSGSNAGAIAGGVVGGVLGLLLIVLVAFFFLRRRKRRGANHNSQTGAELQTMDTGYRQDSKLMGYNNSASPLPTKTSDYKPYDGNPQVTSELAANETSWQAPAEMPGSPNRVVELPGSQGYR